MASFECSAGDGQPAAYLLTNLVDDTTINLCPPHMAAWSAAYLDAWAGPADDGEKLTPPLPQDIGDDAELEEAPSPPPASRKRPPRPTGSTS